MANYFVTYDLNGPRPSHPEMDKHLRMLSQNAVRVLETVWLVKYTGTSLALCNEVNKILGTEDLLLVIDTLDNPSWTKMLVSSEAFKKALR